MDNFIIACFVFSLINFFLLAGMFLFSYLRFVDSDRLKELERLERIRKIYTYLIEHGDDEPKAYRSAVAMVDLLFDDSKK